MKRQIRPIHDKFMTWSDDLVLHLSIFAPIAIGHIGLLLIGNKFRVQQWVVWGNSFVAFGVVALNYVKSHNKATKLQFSIHHSTLMKLKDKLTEILGDKMRLWRKWFKCSQEEAIEDSVCCYGDWTCCSSTDERLIASVGVGGVVFQYVKSESLETPCIFEQQHIESVKFRKNILSDLNLTCPRIRRQMVIWYDPEDETRKLKKQGDPIIEIGREDNKFGEEDNDWAASNGDARNELTVYEDHSSSETWTCRRRSQEEAFSCFETRPQRVDEPSARYNEILYQVVLGCRPMLI
ncbi:hypothetical protein GIB67_039326 [Kingdonia uniflora]|uniref:Uncharacterized protein n=1 Tax=Kingdonia uniflora TaxID=39325 RepID=A0A7J7LN15_9MAGN|nr:hypothetical protein GIB67_039326 [Kingdonia uniflora]